MQSDNSSVFLYPEPIKPLDMRQVDGQYEVFTLVERTIKLNLSKIVASESTTQPTESLLAGAIAMALCYIGRMQRKKPAGVKVYLLYLIKIPITHYLSLLKKVSKSFPYTPKIFYFQKFIGKLLVVK